jgi:hypothetical protein
VLRIKFSGGRQLSASKSASSPSAKTSGFEKTYFFIIIHLKQLF